ncbi:MotE family protein [Brevundimonas sp. PWP3-1b1]|uniref:MotE family protein n=1 Tax=unclassified Brevundimonas TaxID=2622653 RepID=UPI003CF68B15
MARLPRLLPLIAIAIGGVVAVRAIGVAPGLFDGAKAWAEEAAPAAAGAPVKPVLPGTCSALSPEQLAQQAGISPAELRIIQSLSQRREALDARDQDFATTLPLMVAAEQKLEAKIQALAALKAEMKQMLGQVDEREKAEIDRLVQVYSAMRPKEAAPVMATLEDRVRLPVAAAMRPRTLAAIMAQMTPAQAKELTEKLAARFQAQQMAARAAAAEAATPPPAATPAAATPAPTPVAQPAAATATPASRPTPRPAASRPAATPARRPAATPARRPATPAATPPAGPQAYQPSAAPNAQPRQTVQ